MSNKIISFPGTHATDIITTVKITLNKDERNLIYEALHYVKANYLGIDLEYSSTELSIFKSLYEAYKLITRLDIVDPATFNSLELKILTDCIFEFARFLNTQETDLFTLSRKSLLMLLYDELSVSI